MNNSAESSNEGNQNGNNNASSGSQNSNVVATTTAANYSGVVAQRALYGSYKRRFGRRVSGKSAPSRLSNVTAADGNNG